MSVLFFGATAEIVGQRTVTVDVFSDSTSCTVFEKVLNQHPQLASHKLLYSINEQYASGSEKLAEGDRIAVFTAVSGG